MEMIEHSSLVPDQSEEYGISNICNSKSHHIKSCPILEHVQVDYTVRGVDSGSGSANPYLRRPSGPEYWLLKLQRAVQCRFSL